MRFFRLLAASSVGVLAALAAARVALLQLPRPTPATHPAWLALEQRWALNPERRRQAALLRSSDHAHNPARRLALLAAQGWGQGPLAAVLLKQQALTAAALGNPAMAQQLWHHLLHRHHQQAASADALYALGQQQPQLRRLLLQRWPAHPAALAAASELPPAQGAPHLARWGARWPGAANRITTACKRPGTTPQQRQALSQGLAELGNRDAVLTCLAGTPALPATELLLAQSELHGPPDEQANAARRLQQLLVRWPQSPQAQQALRLLAAEDSPAARSSLDQLPPDLQATAPVQASRARQANSTNDALRVLQRWPQDPASWELQWQLARRSALDGQWRSSLRLLRAGGPQLETSMPAALQARRRFWLGLSHWQLGDTAAARSQWQQIVRQWPGGYYGWRASARLGADTGLRSPRASVSLTDAGTTWSPLESGREAVDLLWRLGQPLEAWELWRTARHGKPPQDSRALQAEGRLREAIGDGWTGLGQLELAALRLPQQQCRLQQLVERNRYRPRQLPVLAAASRSERVPLNLLLGIAMQESRFQSDVQSVVGAIGLLQLMPETAAELNGSPLLAAQLRNPQRNARLGSRYLKQLLQRWSDNAVLAVASYNAGPNAVARWLSPALQDAPEVWVEAIPYPETRHYVKTVLGNTWSFAESPNQGCP